MTTSTHTWSVPDVMDALAHGLAAREASLQDEQAVHGLDALDEVALHPVLARSLEQSGFGVHREQRYPEACGRRRRSEGRRCDLVITPEGRPLRQPEAAETLFDDPRAVDLADAFWLEVKCVGQFAETGANAAWSSELLGTVSKDVAKLARSEGILHAGLLLVLWTATVEIAMHDLGIWQDRCLARGLTIAAPVERVVPVLDRRGHAVCTMRLYPVSHL